MTQKEQIAFGGKSLRLLSRIAKEGDLLTRNPAITANHGRGAVKSADVNYPPQVIDLHPGPKYPATVVWRSPSTTSVVVNVRLQDGNSEGGGNTNREANRKRCLAGNRPMAAKRPSTQPNPSM